jgi:hypothetical protein
MLIERLADSYCLEAGSTAILIDRRIKKPEPGRSRDQVNVIPIVDPCANNEDAISVQSRIAGVAHLSLGTDTEQSDC